MESEEVQSDASQEPGAVEGHRKPGTQDAPDSTTAMESSAQCDGGARQDQGAEVEEKSFVSNLHGFMKERGTPIERIPHLGFKQINLWRIYKAVGNLGGYDSVSARRLWKSVYDDLGGSPGSTSAATCTRRHYERLVLPFDRHLRGETDKPLPPGKPRKQYRRNAEKAGKERGKRKTVRMEKELREAQRRTATTEQSETGAPAYLAAPWPVSRALLSCREPPRREPVDGRPAVYEGSRPLCVPLPSPPQPPPPPPPRGLAAVPPPGMVGLSPLEKKKRVAQASLSQPPHPQQDEEKDRPSVIHRPLPQATQPPPAPKGTSSEESPRPVSTSSSRCSSPHSSLSSSSSSLEDLPAAAGGKPEPSSYVTLVSGRRLGGSVTRHPCCAIARGQDIPLQRVQRGGGRESAPACPRSTSSAFSAVNANWPPAPTSSLTGPQQVHPKPAQPLKPTPYRGGCKFHPAGPTPPHDPQGKKLHHSPPWFYQTSERRDKSKLFPGGQPRSLYGGSPPPPYHVSGGFGRAPQPPLLHVFPPERMRTPHSQPPFRQAPVGLSYPAHLYPYPAHFLSACSNLGAPPQSVYPRIL